MAGDAEAGSSTVTEIIQAVSKPKRVRTGCLTCRERHLKCDEGTPSCQNCKKSSRVCKRGIRLNFIDTTIQAPPVVPPTQEWTVSFLDESRDIASEYRGGLDRYAISDSQAALQVDPGLTFDFSASAPPAPIVPHAPLPPIQGMLPEVYPEEPSGMAFDPQRDTQQQHAHSHADSAYSSSNMPGTSISSYSNQEPDGSPSEAPRDYLNTQEEVLFMQVFVEEVGLWMDSMDPMKHVRVFPCRL